MHLVLALLVLCACDREPRMSERPSTEYELETDRFARVYKMDVPQGR